VLPYRAKFLWQESAVGYSDQLSQVDLYLFHALCANDCRPLSFQMGQDRLGLPNTTPAALREGPDLSTLVRGMWLAHDVAMLLKLIHHFARRLFRHDQKFGKLVPSCTVWREAAENETVRRTEIVVATCGKVLVQGVYHRTRTEQKQERQVVTGCGFHSLISSCYCKSSQTT